MRRLCALLAAVAALSCSVAGAAGSSWSQSGHDAAGTGFNAADHAISARNVGRLHVAWSRTIPVTRAAIVAGNRVYAIAGSGHPNVLVLDARSGKLLRTYSDTSLHLNASVYDDPQALAYANGRLVIAAERTLLEINPQTNQEYWHVPGGADQVKIAGRTVYTGKGCQNTCGTIASYAVDLYTGRVLWTHRGNFGSTPMLINGYLYQEWGENKPSTHVYDPASGKLLATMNLNAQWTGDSSHAFAVRMTGGFGAPIHKWISQIGGNGRARWTTDLGSGGDAFPIYAYSTLFVPSHRFQAGLVALNAGNGRLRWAADVGSVLAQAAANHLLYLVQGNGGRIAILNANNGKTLRTLVVPRASYTGTGELMVAGGTLFVLHGQGITAYRV